MERKVVIDGREFTFYKVKGIVLDSAKIETSKDQVFGDIRPYNPLKRKINIGKLKSEENAQDGVWLRLHNGNNYRFQLGKDVQVREGHNVEIVCISDGRDLHYVAVINYTTGNTTRLLNGAAIARLFWRHKGIRLISLLSIPVLIIYSNIDASSMSALALLFLVLAFPSIAFIIFAYKVEALGRVFTGEIESYLNNINL